MDIFHHISSVRKVLKCARQQGKTVGFVPTMGNLHDAHLALVKTAQERADIVIVSIFVNRLQFGLNEDWDKYPRTLEADSAKLRAINCDYLLCPEEQEMYPNGMEDQTRVIVPSMADVHCGASRPGHFDGVTTVVSKLLNIVQPDLAVFGIKDYQQLAIIRRMVADLCIPVEIIAGNIVREHDGLAMSSRNSFINEDERPRANQLHLSIMWIVEQIREGERDFFSLENEAKSKIEAAGFSADYMKICNAHSLQPAAHDDLKIVVLGAMYTQAARLIDNASLEI